MRQIYAVDIGYVEDTVIYELVPKEVGRYNGYTLEQIGRELEKFAHRPLIIIDSQPKAVDLLKEHDLYVIGARL